ncbi:MAG: hypothetical protein AAGJ28_20290 [Pseudomonadota bacterium]
MNRLLVVFLLFAAPAGADEARVDEIVEANTRFALWRVISAPLAHENQIIGYQENRDVLTVFAATRVMDGDNATDIERMLDVAELWLVAEEIGKSPPLHRGAVMDGEAARRVFCRIAIEGPGRVHELIGRWGLPAEQPDTCEEDQSILAEETDALFEAALLQDEPLRAGRVADGYVRIINGFPDHLDIAVSDQKSGQWLGFLRRTEVIESVADQLASEFSIGDLMILADRCGVATVRWDPDQREMTLCLELLDSYARLARIMVAD